MTLPSLEKLRDIVRAAARDELLPLFAEVARQIKHDGSIVTEVDVAMQRRLKADLLHHWPDIAFLGEEMTVREQERLTASAGNGLWCVDPLDGTSNYAAGIPFFAVSLALIANGRSEVGLVYDPIRDECFMGRRGEGAWLDNIAFSGPKPSLPDGIRRCIAAVDFKRLALPLAAQLGAHPPYGSQRNFGASSLEWCWVAYGRFHLYLHGAQKLWDYAAGSLILSEAGGRACTLDGEDVFCLGVATRSVVAAASPSLFSEWKGWIDHNWNMSGR